MRTQPCDIVIINFHRRVELINPGFRCVKLLFLVGQGLVGLPNFK
jgi:hypothetical protein